MGFINHLTKTYHRNLLEKLLIKYRYLIKGKILDIGSKSRRYDHLFNGEITAIDIVPNPEFNVIKGDLVNLDFDSKSFNSVLCLEVFTYLEVDDIKKAFNQIYRVLDKNSKAIISISYIYHENDENFRLTHDYIASILSQFPNFKFKILRIGNKFTSIYDMVRERVKKRKSRFFINIGLVPVCLLLFIIIKLFQLERVEDFFPEGYFIICSKN